MKKLVFTKKTKSQKFHDETKIKFKKISKDNDTLPIEWTTIYYKGYPRFEKIKLPDVIPSTKSLSLIDALNRRKSTRSNNIKKMNLKKLSHVLYYSFGINKFKNANRRFYPSAGGRYPLEVYIIVLNVEGLKKGVYHYHLRTSSLEYLWSDEEMDSRIKDIFVHDWIINSSFIICVSAVFWRTEMKYGDRGYRHILIEAGHASQNVYLLCASLDLGCCSIAGFVDKSINELLDLDGDEESVIASICVGNSL